MEKRHLFMALGGLLVLAFVFAGCTPAAPAEEEIAPPVEQPAEVEEPEAEEPVAEAPAVLGPVTLEYVTWTYDLEKVQQNQDRFVDWILTQHDPAIDTTVQRTEFAYGDFDTSITTIYAGGGDFDVMYSSDHWLAKWATAGWIIPVEDYFPEIRDYAEDMFPFALEAMSFDGKIYGLPYATSVFYFVYNERILEEAGITAPPTTWDELTQQALQIKAAGLTNTPIMMGLQASSWFEEYLFTMIFSEGGSLISPDLEAVFATDSGPAYDSIEWLAAAVNDHGILPNSALEMTAVDAQEAFKQDDIAFVIVPNYMLAEFANAETSKVADHYSMALMPGSTHGTDAYTRLYVLGTGALEDDATLQASYAYLEFLGGKTTIDGVTDYHIDKRWAVANGVAFGPISLWDDPEVIERFSAVQEFDIAREQDALAHSKEGMSAPWYAEWISYVRTEVQKAILRQTTTQQALENIKQQWLDLASE